MIALVALLLQAGHVFQPIDPAWTLVEDTLEVRAGNFVVVKAGERRGAGHWREQRYSGDGRERKILRFDPENRLRLEVDVADGDRFTRILRADGSLSCYQHHRNSRLVDAFSISADGRTIHQIHDGTGELVTEGEEGAWTHLRLLPGITLATDYRGDRRGRVSIWIGSDHYVRTPEREELSLSAPAEHWSIEGQTVDLQMTDLEIVDGKVRRRTVERNTDVRTMPPGSTDRSRIEEVRKEWAAAWPKRRTAFLARVDDAIRAAEQDWARLNLEFVRDGARWPN